MELDLLGSASQYGQVMWVNLLLSGDNALIIAMVCRELPPTQRFWGIWGGTAFAVLCRLALLYVASSVLDYPFVKLVGGLFLLYVAYKMAFEEETDPENKHAEESLGRAILAIVVADVMMSADNVIAVAAAAGGNWNVMLVGILVSVPMVILGATIVEKVLDKLPVLVYAGAAYLAFLAVTTAVEDPIAKPWVESGNALALSFIHPR